MDFTQLRYFMRVAQSGSFRKASDELHVAQPAISRQVRLLEEELGVRLLARHARGAIPTEEGLALLYGAERLFDLALRLKAEVGSMGLQPTGQLKIGVHPAFARHFVAPIVQRLQAAHPQLRLQIVEAFSERLQALVVGGEIDLAVISARSEHPDLSFEPLYTEESWLVGSRRHLTLARRSVRPEFLRGKTVFTTRVLQAELQRRGNPDLGTAIEIEGPTAMAAMLFMGMGWYAGPPTMFWDLLQERRLVGARIAGLALRRYLVRRKDRPEGAAGHAFRHHALRELRSFAAKAGSPVTCDGPVPEGGRRARAA